LSNFFIDIGILIAKQLLWVGLIQDDFASSQGSNQNTLHQDIQLNYSSYREEEAYEIQENGFPGGWNEVNRELGWYLF
jgi:hypothetical protein